MTQQQARRSGGEDDDQSDLPVPQANRDAAVRDSDRGDDLLDEIDRLLDDAVVYEQYVQKGGQ